MYDELDARFSHVGLVAQLVIGDYQNQRLDERIFSTLKGNESNHILEFTKSDRTNSHES